MLEAFPAKRESPAIDLLLVLVVPVQLWLIQLAVHRHKSKYSYIVR